MTILLAIFVIALLTLALLVLFTANVARGVRKAIPPVGRFVEVPGARLHIRDIGEGSGPALLLIHGIAGSMDNFNYAMTERLAQTHRVVVIDRPGCGYSLRASGASADLATQAQSIAGLIDLLGLERPVIVGHSLGGGLSLRLALDFPDKVSGLALIAPVTTVNRELIRSFQSLRIQSVLLRKILAWTIAAPMTIRNSELVMKFTFGPDKMPPDFPRRGGGLWSLIPSHFLAMVADAIAFESSVTENEKQYGQLRLPIHVLYGTKDRVLNYQLHGVDFVPKLVGTTLESIEGAGHMLPITHADACIALIERVVAASRTEVKA